MRVPAWRGGRLTCMDFSPEIEALLRQSDSEPDTAADEHMKEMERLDAIQPFTTEPEPEAEPEPEPEPEPEAD